MFQKILLMLAVFALAACGGDGEDTDEDPTPDVGVDAGVPVDADEPDTDVVDMSLPACQAPEVSCNGVCVNTTTDVEHCGACDNPCESPAGAVASCASMSCDYTCEEGRFDLDGDLGEADGNGCEATCMPTGDEVCDGIDNNCDGSVDEGCDCTPGNSRDCGSSVGECEFGTQMCRGSGVWGTCNGGVVPEPEVCDGLDNDCDGTPDNDPIDADQDCPTGQPGACSVGTYSCEQGELVCNLTTRPTNELCNGIDDNCNGQVDEGNPESGVACSAAGNMCMGTTTCEMGAVVCEVTQVAEPEMCDGLDNDCDGEVDEEALGTGGVCDTGLLATCAAGTEQCVNGSLECVPDNPPVAEVCDGFDNDCDGLIDEPCPTYLGFQLSQGLSFYGDNTANTTSLRCGNLAAITRVWARTGSSLRSIQAGCETLGLETDTTVTPYLFDVIPTGTTSTTSVVGFTGGTSSQTSCPAGENVVGIFGKYDTNGISSLGIRCAKIDVDNSTFDLTRAAVTDISIGGGNSGTAFTSTCPGAFVATGLGVAYDGFQITAIRIVCTAPALLN